MRTEPILQASHLSWPAASCLAALLTLTAPACSDDDDDGGGNLGGATPTGGAPAAGAASGGEPSAGNASVAAPFRRATRMVLSSPFVARKPATGYRVAFVPFEAGEPQAIEDFVSGFLIRDGNATFGRPAGVTVAADGALLFTDDTNGIVYRVQYE